jgi:collagen type IX alpha
LDNYEQYRESVRKVAGSRTLQTAYRIERESNLTMRAEEAFPRGAPFQFSFECTYRLRQQQTDPWYIIHLTNAKQESQLALTMNPSRKTFSLTLPDSNGILQTVEFRSSKVSNFILLHHIL